MILKFCGRYSSVFAKKKNEFVILQKKRSKIVCYRVKWYNWFSIFCFLFLQFFANKDILVYFYNGVVIVHWEKTRFESTIYQTNYLKFQHRWGTSGLNSAKWLLNCYFLRMLVMKQILLKLTSQIHQKPNEMWDCFNRLAWMMLSNA